VEKSEHMGGHIIWMFVVCSDLCYNLTQPKSTYRRAAEALSVPIIKLPLQTLTCSP